MAIKLCHPLTNRNSLLFLRFRFVAGESENILVKTYLNLAICEYFLKKRFLFKDLLVPTGILAPSVLPLTCPKCSSCVSATPPHFAFPQTHTKKQ